MSRSGYSEDAEYPYYLGMVVNGVVVRRAGLIVALKRMMSTRKEKCREYFLGRRWSMFRAWARR